LYPNQYVIFVGPPGGGKSTPIAVARNLIETDHTLKEYMNISPRSVTRERFFQLLETAGDKMPNVQPGTPVDQLLELQSSAMSIMTDEFGTIMQTKNMEFIRALTDLYDTDAHELWSHETKHSSSSHIKRPCVNILAGTTPSDLADILPHHATTQGVTSRMMLIFATGGEELAKKQADPWATRSKTTPEEYAKALVHDLQQVLEMQGEYIFAPETRVIFKKWLNERGINAPVSPALENYNSRRAVHLAKLCMCIAASRRNELEVRAEDITTGIGYLHEAEETMPEALGRMGLNPLAGKTEETYKFILRKFHITGKPVPEYTVRNYLEQDVKSYEINYYLSQMEVFCKTEGIVPVRKFIPAGFVKEEET